MRGIVNVHAVNASGSGNMTMSSQYFVAKTSRMPQGCGYKSRLEKGRRTAADHDWGMPSRCRIRFRISGGKHMNDNGGTRPAPVTRLTERQKDCLRLVARGYRSKEIGRLLGISYTTVDNHVRLALEIMGASDRGEAARALAAYEAVTRDGANQTLTSHAAAIAAAPGSPDQGWQEVQDGQRKNFWHWLGLPPLGGRADDLSHQTTTVSILKIAAFALTVMVALTLIVAFVLWVLR